MPNMPPMTRRHPSGKAVAAQVLAAAGAPGAGERRFALALSPAAIDPDALELLAGDDFIRGNAHIFLADTRFEGCVPGAAGLHRLLRPLVARDAQLHLEVANHADAERAAAAYEQELRAFFGIAVGDLPRFDVVVLRMDSCGGLAGLLANSHALDETNRLAVANRAPATGRRFVTLTPPVIQRAGRVVVIAHDAAIDNPPPYGIAGRLLAAANVTLLA
jgi:6-phosphogluconolactonase